MLRGSRSHWRTLLVHELLDFAGWDAQPGGAPDSRLFERDFPFLGGPQRNSIAVAVSRQMFAHVLSLIARLRAPPAPA
jgi:hypothetical protein